MTTTTTTAAGKAECISVCIVRVSATVVWPQLTVLRHLHAVIGISLTLSSSFQLQCVGRDTGVGMAACDWLGCTDSLGVAYEVVTPQLRVQQSPTRSESPEDGISVHPRG